LNFEICERGVSPRIPAKLVLIFCGRAAPNVATASSSSEHSGNKGFVMDGRHHAREDWVMLVASRLERHGIPTGSESPRDVAERIYDETSGLTPHEGISYYRAELDRQNMTADERRKGEWIFACCKRISGLDECFTEMALDDFYDVAVLLWNDFGHVPVDRIFPSATAPEPDDALGGWRGRVVIDLPTGQASWIYHDSDAGLFADLPAQSPAARHG